MASIAGVPTTTAVVPSIADMLTISEEFGIFQMVHVDVFSFPNRTIQVDSGFVQF